MQLPVSAWSRLTWRGSLISQGNAASGTVSFVGVLESHELATNFDVLVDVSESTFLVSVGVYVAIYATVGSQKVYVSQWVLGFSSNPAFVSANKTTVPAASLPGTGGNGLSGGLTGLVQAGGLASTCWGVELGLATLSTDIPLQLNNVFVGAIAHGVEQ
jgi:hypothetical protein